MELAEQIKNLGQQSTAELLPLLQKAERLAEDEAEGLLTRALAHRAAANALQILRQFHPALDHYNKATEILESIDEPTELGRTLHAKVVPLFLLNRFDDLFDCAGRARALFQGLGDAKRLARLDVNLAHAHHRLGRHVESLECSERARPVLNDAGDREGFLAATINSAVTFSAMHEFELAEERFREALALANELHMPARVLLSRFNLAYLRYLGGDTAEALEEFRNLRKEYEAAKDDWQVCLCWLDEAEILLEIGDLEEAIRSARQAGELAKKLGLNSEIGKALLFEASATLRLGQDGQADQAFNLLNEAIRRFEAEGNPVLTAVSRLQAALLRGEGGTAMALSEAASARSLLRDSGLPHRLALADIVIGRIQRALGDGECAINSFESALSLAKKSRSEWMQFHSYYELGASLTSRSPDQGADLLHQAEGMLDSLWSRLGSDDLKMSFLADRENVYTHLVPLTLEKSAESAFELSEKARSRVLREQMIPGAFNTAASIQAGLGDNESIVEYFIAGNDLYIFVVRRDRLVPMCRTNVVGGIRDHCLNLDRHFLSCSVKWEHMRAAETHLRATAETHLQKLYEELVAPIEHELSKSVIFVPHGFLHSIPFHALHDGHRFLMDKCAVLYSPSASLYCAPAPAISYEEPLFIAFSRGSHISSVQEIEEASSHFPGATVLINPDGRELGGAFEKPRSLVHIAGHAGIDAVGGKLSWIESPDGRLTGRDLTDMHIRARTLVITGCQTARRPLRPGDEWLGLMRSFYTAGASAIVSAFWDIRAESARRFASEFYRRFAAEGLSEAVRAASTAVREWETHPYFWAGFGVFCRRGSEPRQSCQ